MPAPGIVHIGLGAFHRGHQAVYLQSYRVRTGDDRWDICAANIRSNKAICDALSAANHRYAVVAYQNSQTSTVTQVESICEALFAGESRSELLARLCLPSVAIVTLTVTEKGYGLKPSGLELNMDDPAIAADWVSLAEPRSVPGLLLLALLRRRELGLAAFTVLSCDNIPHNGARARTAVMALAERHTPEACRWLADLAFPSSMVDRIVPAVDEAALGRAASVLGYRDDLAVITEQFSQWVVEDCFPLGRPDWEHDGVTMVSNVASYETMKLRLLNGAHSILAYAGLMLGHSTVDQAVADPVLLALVRAYFAEAIPTISVDVDLNSYCEALLVRFANDSLNHRLAQIAMDGSQKIPQRWLNGVTERSAQGKESPVTALAFACWLIHHRGAPHDAAPYPVNDPLADQMAFCVDDDRAVWVERVLAVSAVVPSAIATDASFKKVVVASLDALMGAASEDDLISRLARLY